ncbi:PACE efflux transporter [Vibrio hibernica]|uniref:PACE efflux transporter n=1 Tax=Vibrio hibernica TaxID=2587465 RepID=UPI0039B01E98
MTTKERVFHVAIFELLALSIVVPASAWLSGKSLEQMAGLSASITVLAVIWNYVYNIVFDKVFGENRQQRKWKLRLVHTFGFEGGLIVATVPIVAWVLEVTLLHALIVDAGFLLFFLVYTFVFNWLYDNYQPYQRCFSRQTS